jgi:hypothetical protein
MAMLNHGFDELTPEVQKRKSLIPNNGYFHVDLRVSPIIIDFRSLSP